ncbi:insulinase family protein [Gramella sp. AN32]|uniref:M16 family metallopeptidase n=1 Tax=Christiangramia antarctica TaxID=2058158 RepID=A0ABW5X9X6_9FLAO|nr:insulinase family protein [Gramella sp. AN32]MCM4157615.1 hypothetical protein [Gramella sp. AN32]
MKVTKMRIFISCIIIIFGLGSGLVAQGEPDIAETNLDASVRYGRLDNGFTYYLKHNQEPEDKIEIIFSVRAGYYQQNEKQMEYAHLMEHMGTFHTKKFPALREYTDSVGIYNHARTGYDNTMYTITLPSGDKNKLNAALDIVHEWSQNILLRKEDVAVQSGAIIAEGRSKTYHQDWVVDTLSNIILSNTNFELKDKKGRKASMKNVDLQALKDYRDKWYRTDLEAAIIVGDINIDSLENVLRNRFKDLKLSSDTKNPEPYNERHKVKLKGDNQYKFINDSIDRSSRLVVIKKKLNDETYVRSRADFKRMVLQNLSRRMLSEMGTDFKNQYDPPFHNYTNSFMSNSLGGGQIQTSAWSVDLDDDLDIKAKMTRLFKADQLLKKSLNHQLLNEAKKEVLAELVATDHKSDKIALKLHNHFISGTVAWTADQWQEELTQTLESIDLDALKNHIDYEWDFTKNSDFIFFNVPQDKLPDHQTVMKWYREAKKQAAVKSGFQFQKIKTMPNRFSSSKSIKADLPEANEIGISKLTLRNGINLIFKPSKPASNFYKNEVSIYGYKNVPVSFQDREEYLKVVTAPKVMFYGDVGEYSKFQIKDYMLEHRINLNYHNINNQFIIDGKFKSEHIQDFFNILYLYLIEPKYNEIAFKSWKKDEILNLSTTKDYNSMIREITDKKLYTTLPELTGNDINTIRYQEYHRAYKRFSNLKGYTFIITGDFDPEKLMSQVGHYFSEFSTNDIGEICESKFAYRFEKFSEKVPYENTSQAVVELYFPIKVKKDVKTQALLDLVAFRLNQVVFDRLRVGTYTPRARGIWMDYTRGIYAFNISFDSDYGFQDHMIENALEEFNKLKASGVTSDWLQTTNVHLLNQYGRQLETFWLVNIWPEYLKRYENYEEEGIENLLKYESILNHFIDIDDVNLAAKKYLSEEKRQEIIIIPTESEEL